MEYFEVSDVSQNDVSERDYLLQNIVLLEYLSLPIREYLWEVRPPTLPPKMLQTLPELGKAGAALMSFETEA